MTTGLFTCGLGDFLSIHSLMTQAEDDAITKLIFATRAEDWIKSSVPNNDLNLLYKNLKDSESINHGNWAGLPHQRGSLYNIHTKLDLRLFGVDMQSINNINDYSNRPIINDFGANRRSHRGLNFYKHTILSDISKFDLPNDYIVIHPHSDNYLMKERTLYEDDIRAVLKYLDKHDITGVVINKTNYPAGLNSDINLFDHPRILDLTNKSSITDGFELIKHARGFVGSASSFSVFAGFVGDNDFLNMSRIKSHINFTNKAKDSGRVKRFYYPNYSDRSLLIDTEFISIGDS